ncbi:MAG TPA: hypothetical protein VN132_08535 [Bdellovibrio sp.]|nr:hypothetical protein [Bdellovibrio sp.]
MKKMIVIVLALVWSFTVLASDTSHAGSQCSRTLSYKVGDLPLIDVMENKVAEFVSNSERSAFSVQVDATKVMTSTLGIEVWPVEVNVFNEKSYIKNVYVVDCNDVSFDSPALDKIQSCDSVDHTKLIEGLKCRTGKDAVYTYISKVALEENSEAYEQWRSPDGVVWKVQPEYPSTLQTCGRNPKIEDFIKADKVYGFKEIIPSLNHDGNCFYVNNGLNYDLSHGAECYSFFNSNSRHDGLLANEICADLSVRR